MPDLFIALALCALTMGATFLAVSFVVPASGAEADLARLFAASLLLTGLFTFALGFSLLGDDRETMAHYLYPTVVGVVIGGLEAVAFLVPLLLAIPLPFLLLIVLFGPIRRRLERMATPGHRVTG